MDPLDALNRAIAAVGAIAKAAGAISTADLRLRIGDLAEQLMEAKVRGAGLVAENAALKERLAAKENPPTRREGVCYFADAPGEPCCPKCWDGPGRSRAVMVRPTGAKAGLAGVKLRCPVCKYDHPPV